MSNPKKQYHTNLKKISADMIRSEANWKCSVEVQASRALGQADVRVQYQFSLLRIIIIVISYDFNAISLKVIIVFQLTKEFKWNLWGILGEETIKRLTKLDGI